MKVGIRTPSPTKSLKARTTGRVKRAVKRSYNPFYGKKGVGYLKDPERAAKNKVYHKVTVDPLDNVKKSHSHSKALTFPMILFYLVGIISGAFTEFVFLSYRNISILGICATVIGFTLFVLLYRSMYS